MLLRQKSTIDHQKLFLQNYGNKLWTFIAEKFPVLCNNFSGSFLWWLRLHLLGKQNKPCFCIKHKFRAIYRVIKVCIYIIIIFFRAQNDKFKCIETEPEPPEAAIFCLEPESAPGPRTSGEKKWRLRYFCTSAA